MQGLPGAVPGREVRAVAPARGVVLAWEPGQVSGLAREAVPELAQAVVPALASVRGLDQSQARAPAGGLEPAQERAAVQAREPEPARRAVPEPVQAEALAWAFGLDPGSGQA